MAKIRMNIRADEQLEFRTQASTLTGARWIQGSLPIKGMIEQARPTAKAMLELIGEETRTMRQNVASERVGGLQ